MTTLTGTLLKGDGTPEVGVTVRAHPDWQTQPLVPSITTDTPLTTQTDGTGLFSLAGLIAGTWYVDLLTSGTQKRRVVALPASGSVDLAVVSDIVPPVLGVTYALADVVTAGFAALDAKYRPNTLPDIQTFYADGTWTKPPGARWVQAYAIAPGGPGGSGRVDPTTTNAVSGGGGGGSGGRGFVNLPAFVLSATETVLCAAPGTPGAAVTGTSNGNSGTNAAGPAAFGSVLRVNTGAAGGGGTNATGTAGGAGLGTMGAAAGGGGSVNAGGSGANGPASGGGGGGGVSTSNVPLNGGNGGVCTDVTTPTRPVGAGGAINTAGGAGSSAAVGAVSGGTGGGGGGGSTGDGQDGGPGGSYGAGGGGGGGGRTRGGAGGAGGPGIVVVVTW